MQSMKIPVNSLRMCELRGLLLIGLAVCASIRESNQQATRLPDQDVTGGSLHDLLSQQKVGSQQQQPLRIGSAPHDRASCQIQQLISSHRRHQQQILPADRLNNESPAMTDSLTAIQQQSNSSLANPSLQSPALQLLTGISTPSVTSLSPESGGSGSSNNARQSQRKFDSSERLRQLRQLLASNSYDAYLVNPNDEHGSEFIADQDRRLRFISGFTGTNGFALILADKAVLFTDGRYALQAEMELDCNWWLVVSSDPLADIPVWLKAHAPKGLKIATDARLMSLQSYDFIDEHLKRMDSEFALISQDLVDVVWDAAVQSQQGERALTKEPLFIHPLQFAGNVTWQEKVYRLSESMSKLRANHYIISRLDDIAWLLNLRGSDIPISPLFKAFLFVSRSANKELLTPAEQTGQLTTGRLATTSGLQAPQVTQVQPNQSIRITMYVDLKKIDQSIRDYLYVDNGTFFVQSSAENNSPTTMTRIQLELKDYEVFIMDLRDKLSGMNGINRQQQQQQGKLLLDVGANVAIHVLAKVYEDRLVLMESLIVKLKAVKSDSEVQGMRAAHWRDSLAISMLLAQLEADIGQRKLVNKWTETGAADELEYYRSLMDLHKGISFDTISAYGPTSAIIHYQPSREEARFIGNKSTYLLDTGAQYLDGTTDITRTSHYGEPTDFQRETYTRVLMGAIDTMALVFDASPRSGGVFKLNDLIARRHLFEIGLDYAHGTGHGIGLFSMCHEAPWLLEHYASGSSAGKLQLRSGRAGSSPQVHSEPVALQANMFTSVEPGYYKANDFGIRLENIVVTQPHQLVPPPSSPAKQSASSVFLRFEPISLVPFEPKLIKYELMSNKQKSWLNSYNLMVRFRLTQQINYYLGKIRASSQQQQPQVASMSEPIQVRGLATSSRIYRHLMAQQRSSSSSRATNQSSAPVENFLRLDGAQFQEKLEQTHRWIMQKTELIPLDVPQAMVASSEQHQGSGAPGAYTQVSSSRSRLESQRLMLVYMSALPFYDQDAREALSQLGSRSESVDDEGKGEKMLTGRGAAAVAGKNSSTSHRCSGFQCDLLLASALASMSQPENSRLIQRIGSLGKQATGAWQEDEQAYEFATSLSDLFQLSNSNSSQLLVPVNIWSACLFLGTLLLLQVAIAVCMCKVKQSKPQVSVGSSKRSSSNTLQVSPSIRAPINHLEQFDAAESA